MAGYKTICTSPSFLAVDLEKQILQGRFEIAVHQLLDHEFDLSRFVGTVVSTLSGVSSHHVLPCLA